MFYRYSSTSELTPAIWQGEPNTPLPDDFGDLVYDEKDDKELEIRVDQALQSNFTWALSHAAYGFGGLRHETPAKLFPLLKLQFERCASMEEWTPLSHSSATIGLPETLLIIRCQILGSIANEYLLSEDAFRMISDALNASDANLQHSALTAIKQLSFKAESLASEVRGYLAQVDGLPFPQDQIRELNHLATQFIYTLERRDEQGNPIDLKITSLKKFLLLTGSSTAPHPISGVFRSSLRDIEFDNLIVKELTSAHNSQRVIEIESRYSNWNVEHILKVFRLCSIPLMNESDAFEFQIEKTDSLVLASGEFRSDSPLYGSARIQNYEGPTPVTISEQLRDGIRHLALNGDADDLGRLAAYLNLKNFSNLCVTNLTLATQSS